MIGFFRKRLVMRIAAAVMCAMLVVAAGGLLLQLSNMKQAAEKAISSYNIQIAESFVKQLDTTAYAEFAAQPQEDARSIVIRDELDLFRERIGAMYVYFVRIDDQDRPLIMVDGMKDPEKASSLNEVTDIPPKAIQELKQGRSASSDVINNQEYGQYISSYAPIIDSGGGLVGVIGIDTSVKVIGQIEADLLRASAPLYALLAAITCIGIAAVLWVIVRGLRPLHPLKASVNKMAGGELAEAGQILRAYPLRSEDEIGSTYAAVLHMSDNLNKLVSDMVAGVASTTAVLTDSTEQFRQDAAVMLKMNLTVDASVGQIRQGAHEQKQGAGDSAQAIEEIAKGIHDISESSTAVSDAAADVLSKAQTGQQSMTRMKEQMGSISLSAVEVSERVQTLNRYSAEIGGVLDTVREFAAQTKLLALNASIEAAQAGEHGRGFAVVAAEVRKLAEASAASVQAMSSLLLGIQGEAGHIGVQMETAVQEVGNGVQLTMEAEASFTHVVDAFRLVARSIQEVSAAAEEITAGSEEAAASVHTISEISAVVSDRSDEIYRMAGEQSALFQKIAELSGNLQQQTREMTEAVSKVKV